MFTANYTIEERNSINEGSEEDINQLIGECYLLRAYMHFLLVNLYGQPYTRPGALETKAVPLKLNSDINEILKKNTVAQIYEAVLSDINEAEKLINKESWEQKFSYRFTTLSVKALRARVLLYMGQWDDAYKARSNAYIPVNAVSASPEVLGKLELSFLVRFSVSRKPSQPIKKRATIENIHIFFILLLF